MIKTVSHLTNARESALQWQSRPGSWTDIGDKVNGRNHTIEFCGGRFRFSPAFCDARQVAEEADAAPEEEEKDDEGQGPVSSATRKR
jgi:hypothetical protein